MKKLMAFLLSALLALGGGAAAFASDSEEPLETSGGINEAEVEIPAKSGLLMDFTTGTVLYEKQPHEAMPPASVTKIMTMLLVMEAIAEKSVTMEDMVVCSAHAASMGGTQIWLKEGEEMLLRDLLKATAVASANDAAMALAEHVGGSEEAFVARMNEKAAALGMQDTCFKNPTGLDADGHVSSAYDIALMSRALLQCPGITEFTSIWMDSLRGGKTELVNTNKLVRFYKGCTGLKTGTTDGAGSCVSVSAVRGEMSLISVIMGAQTSKERFLGARRLLDYGFDGFVIVKTGRAGEALPELPVVGGVENSVELESDSAGVLVVKKGQKDAVQEEIILPESVEAPVEEGMQLGEIRVTVEGQQIAVYPIRAKNTVEKLTIGKAFLRLFERLTSTQL